MELNAILQQRLRPAQALIIYRREDAENNHYSREHDGSYVEIHPIVAQGDRYALGPGAPLSKRQIVRLASLAVSATTALLNGFIPGGRVLYLDPSPAAARLIWWRPPEKRALIFDEERSGIASGEYPLPALVFDLKDQSLSVYAAETATLTPDTALMNAPLPNIYQGGAVCMGDCRLPSLRGDIAARIGEYEELFYRSKFTHFNNDRVCKSPVTTLFRKLAGTDTFPTEELIPLDNRRTTLHHIINRRNT